MKKGIRSLILLLAAAAFSLEGYGAEREASSDEKVTARIGYFSTQTQTPQVYIAEGLGYFEEELGDQAEVELIPFANGPAANEAIISGDLEFVFGLGDLPALNSWRNGVDTLIISKTGVGGENMGLVVSGASGITSVEELAGKNVGVYLGTVHHKSILGILGDHGLDAGDVNLINIDSVSTALASLANGELDAYYCANTYYTKYLEENGIAYLLEDSSAYPSYGYFAGTAEFIHTYPDITEKLLRALYRANQYIEENPEDSYKIVAEFLEVEEDVAQYAIEYGKYNLDLEEKDIQNLYTSEEFLQSINAVENPLTDSEIESHIDTSYIDKIVKE